MKCPTCKSDNPQGMNFCGKCGRPALADTYPPQRLQKKFLPARALRKGSARSSPSFSPTCSGYTPLSEKLDPEDVKEITTRIFAEVARIISKYDGFTEKYIGDAVLAFFGVPRSCEDDHIRAIEAAHEIHESVKTLGTEYEEKIGTGLTFRTGITTGPVVMGGVDPEKGTHGIAGDTINFASRLCSIAKPGEILVGESTYLKSIGAFSFERLKPVSVKGKTTPVTPYRFIGVEEPIKSIPESQPEKVPPSVSTAEGERKHVTVVFSRPLGLHGLISKGLTRKRSKKDHKPYLRSRSHKSFPGMTGLSRSISGMRSLPSSASPSSHEDDHIRALKAACEIHEGITRISGDYEEKIDRSLVFHTGIATGLVVTGEVNLEKGTNRTHRRYGQRRLPALQYR